MVSIDEELASAKAAFDTTSATPLVICKSKKDN
jgi:hypothetical protein